MSKTKLTRRVAQLRKAGLSFRAIEARFPKSLGAGNGTKAYRLMAGRPLSYATRFALGLEN